MRQGRVPGSTLSRDAGESLVCPGGGRRVMAGGMDRRHFLKAATLLAAASPLSAALAQDSVEAAGGIESFTENLNPVIQKARDAALAVLQPSAKDLQHGLELHADSLVFDSY